MRQLIFSIILFLALALPAHSAEVYSTHAITLYDSEPAKYGKNFTHFDYVNPSAPKGGTIRLGAVGTFDSFNTFIAKGNAVGTGSVETLISLSADEPFTAYGLIAESFEWPEDRSWIIFNLRPEARWHDGAPLTADDVVWSFNILIEKGAPSYRYYYASVESAEKLDDHKVRFNFKESGNRELPLIMGQLPILPKHYWENRDFTETTLEPPLGSGPYRIKDFEAGRFLVKKRVVDYWGKDLAVNQGTNNFDEIRTNFYRDPTSIRLGLKAGDIDFRSENQSKAWSENYNVAAVEQGLLKKEMIPHQTPTGMQGFVFNTRREIFKDSRVREALGYAFDFEWSNRTLFNGQYTRTTSFFSNSDLASTGMPAGEELEILERYRGQIPDRTFTEEFRLPVTDGSGRARENLWIATNLLAEAGWEVRDLELIHAATGTPMAFEVLLYSPAFERIVLPFTRNLEQLGVKASISLIDQTQYINRLRAKDFDMVIWTQSQSETPGNEQRGYWGTVAADEKGSRNFYGIKDPVVDELVELLVVSESREQLNARTRALDRVLLWGFYVIPQWHIRADRILYWNKFSRPSTPVRTGVMTGRWWYDKSKTKALENSRQ